MRKGKPLNDRLKHLLIAEYLQNRNYTQVAQTFDVSPMTVRKMIKDNPDLVEEYSQKANEVMFTDTSDFRQEFLKKAEQSISKAIDLSQERIDMALAANLKYYDLVQDLIKALKDGGLDAYAVADMVKSLNQTMTIPLKDLSTYIGVLYDKRALSTGEATARTEVKGEMTTNNNNLYTLEKKLITDSESQELLRQLYRRVNALPTEDISYEVTEPNADSDKS